MLHRESLLKLIEASLARNEERMNLRPCTSGGSWTEVKYDNNDVCKPSVAVFFIYVSLYIRGHYKRDEEMSRIHALLGLVFLN